MNNMTDEEAKVFNLGCGVLLGKDLPACCYDPEWSGYNEHGQTPIRFNPAHDSNDLDLVIEKILSEKLVEEVCMSVTEGEYMCSFLFTKFTGIAHIQPSMKQAKIKCIQQVLRGKV